MYRLQLYRSGDSRLRVVVDLGSRESHQYTNRMRQMLWSSSSRWIELDLDDGTPHQWNDDGLPFVLDPQCDLSNLQKVYTGRSDDLVKVLPRAPGLKTVVYRQLTDFPTTLSTYSRHAYRAACRQVPRSLSQFGKPSACRLFVPNGSAIGWWDSTLSGAKPSSPPSFDFPKDGRQCSVQAPKFSQAGVTCAGGHVRLV
ncbi:hypothetical protein BDV98DRAFT_577642 [Pterulicium gracile]|uniref:Uncharacterized protein n=1 Tax=Pterulicium gracile TaxID=1884261 RepID=A0A5C3Q067_9AGAR|nr:hypothetical protein BDV98DRAFT_577642 [Pterula gracilis]